MQRTVRLPFAPSTVGKFPVFHLRVNSVDETPDELDGQHVAEAMGTKVKFWLHNETTSQRALVKFAREGTGEHWSEKLAAEVADLLGVPHPPVEIGLFDQRPVSLTLGFLREGETLIHGNELLSQLDPSYSSGEKNYRPKAHTVDAVHRALSERAARAPGELHPTLSAFGAFVGYLLLDALIGNVDRHHENWALIHKKEGDERILALAPSYDHASSLGRELTPDQAREFLQSKDRLRVEGYFRKALSKFFSDDATSVGQRKPLGTVEAFVAACAIDPVAAHFWRGRLEAVSLDQLFGLPERLPESVVSSDSKDLARFLLEHNYDRLRDLEL